MGLSSCAMVHLRHIDPVVVLVGTQPFDPHDALLEVDGHHETVIIALDIEHDPLSADDACRGIELPHIGGTHPACLADFVEPRIERRLHCRLISPPREANDELTQSAAGYD